MVAPFTPWIVRVHPDVDSDLDALDHAGLSVRRKVAWALLELACHGRTGRVKGTVGQAWRRTPVAGNAHYLYWAPRGATEVSTAHASPREILVRAVREHDATGEVLPAGPLELYRVDDLGAADPRSDAQREAFAREGDACVHEISGPPGTGKTVALLYATRDSAARAGLYVTWSAALAETARAFFAAHGISDRVHVTTVRALVARLAPAMPDPGPEGAGERAFRDAASTYAKPLLGPWLGREDALWAELRGVVFGLALPFPIRRGATELPACGRLDEPTYRALTDLDAAGASAVLAFASLAGERRFFPDLDAARNAIGILQDAVPGDLASVETIAIDEAQDLAPVELALLVSLARALRKSGRKTHVFVCGDVSQTLRPTAFSWGTVGDLAYQRLGVAAAHAELVAPLRQPRTHLAALEAATRLYRGLDKELRPTVRRSAEDTDAAGRLWIAPSPSSDERAALLAALAAAPGRAMVTLTRQSSEPHSDVRGAASSVVFRPEEIKGLERAVVVVSGLGEALRDVRRLVDAAATHADRLAGREARRLVDRVRVALSRSTDTLVLLDDAPDVVAALTLDLETERLPVDELLRRLEFTQGPVEDRIWGFLDEARELAAHGDHDRAAERLAKAREQAPATPDDALAEELRATSAALAPSDLTIEAGDADGLRLALARVAEGGIVRLAPGTYVGEYVVSRTVTITSTPTDAKTVLLSSANATVLFDVRGGVLTLAHVSLALDGERRDAGGAVVRCVQAREVHLGHCAVSSSVVPALLSVDKAARAVVSRCRFHDAAEAGILLDGGARAEVRDSSFERIPYPLVAIHGSRLAMSGASFATSSAAIRIGDATAHIRDCRITGARDWSVQVEGAGAKAVIEECHVRGAPIGIGNGADVELSGNRIEGTKGAAIDVANASPVVRKNVVSAFDAIGIRIGRSSGGLYEDNVVRGSARGIAIAVSGGSAPIVRRHRIGPGGGTGLQIFEDARGTYEHNRVDGMKIGGVHCGNRADPVVRHNTIRNSGSIGILVERDACGVFEDNVVEGSGVTEVAASRGARPLVRRNQLRARGKSLALVATEGAVLVAEGNTITSASTAIVIEAGSAMHLRSNRVDARRSGLVVKAGATVFLANNAFRSEGPAVVAQPGCRVEEEPWP
jgi:hypothetical protein